MKNLFSKCALAFIPLLLSNICVAEPSMEDVLPGTATIVAIENHPWSEEAGNRIVARGPMTITVAISAPEKYKGDRRTFGVYRKEELVICSRNLAVGDVIRFRAFRAVFESAAFPNVFANLKDIMLENPIVNAGEAKKR